MFTRKPIVMYGAMLVLWAFLLGVSAAPQPADAFSFNSGIARLVKIFGIAWCVDHFGGKINDTINSLLKQHEAEIQGHTKVVPILRVGGGGGGTAVGAAQIMGPKEQVDQVQAVGEVELNITGSVRARGLLPISTKNMTSLKIVPGVGCSANIKFPL
jgi:hypothetical protein